MAELNQAPAKAGGSTRKKLSTRVDLTAMVDLAFLLVTFFMLTTSLTKPKALDLAMPTGDTQEPVAASRTVTVCLGKNNQLVYYRGELSDPIDAPLTGASMQRKSKGRGTRDKFGNKIY